MKQMIVRKLQNLEKMHSIKIFFAVESGSRAWGFASKNSDYDVRFLYYHRPEWYFSLKKQTDAIVRMEDDNLFDFAGWELKKTLTLLLKGNMSLYEWMHSPVVYLQTPEYDSFSQLAKEFYDPKALLFSYVSLAENNYKTLIKQHKIKKKKYLYILRTLAACRWIERKKTPPPIVMNELKQVLHENTQIETALTELIETKKTGKETDTITPLTLVNTWIEKELTYYQKLAEQMPSIQKDSRLLSRFLYDTIRNQ